MEDGEAIEHPWVSRAIENAQKKVEGRNFEIRKQLLEYDDVANEQRKVIYDQRKTLMEVDDISETIEATRSVVINAVIDRHITPQSLEEQWSIPNLEKDLESEFGLPLGVAKWLEEDSELHEETLRREIEDAIDQAYRSKALEVGEPAMRHLEKAVMLRVLDERWKEHLSHMDHLRQGIGLRGYAQKNPKQEYKREAFEMFTSMLDDVKQEVITILSKIHIQTEDQVTSMEKERRVQDQRRREYLHPDAEATPSFPDRGELDQAPGPAVNTGSMGQTGVSSQPFVRSTPKVGRNEPCPCGSGKKYKHCHGSL